MNCQHCGTALSNHARFCPACGGEQNSFFPPATSGPNQRLIGYSERINDPRIAAMMQKINRSGLVFTLILAVVAVIGFTVAGAAEVGGFELPSALYYGLGIGGLLLVIGVIGRIRTGNDQTWDGTIESKKTKHPSYSDRQRGHYKTYYYLFVRRTDGKLKKIASSEDYNNYFQIGDRVRHHAGTAAHNMEKYDKSQDSIIYCVACTSKNEITSDSCHRCKSPLLN